MSFPINPAIYLTGSTNVIRALLWWIINIGSTHHLPILWTYITTYQILVTQRPSHITILPFTSLFILNRITATVPCTLVKQWHNYSSLFTDWAPLISHTTLITLLQYTFPSSCLTLVIFLFIKSLFLSPYYTSFVVPLIFFPSRRYMSSRIPPPTFILPQAS